MRSSLVALIRAEAAPSSAPVVPGSWDVTHEDAGWSSVYPLGRADGRCFHARLLGRTAALRGVFVVLGSPALLQALSDRIAADALPWTATWPGIAALRADSGASAVAVKAAWQDDRPRDEGDQPIGTLVAMRAAMAGFTDDDGEA